MSELLAPIHAFLGCPTPQGWIDAALQNLPLIIQDHANCEKKAASTGLNLMFRYNFYSELQAKLAQLVREEMLHYEQVLDIMQSRNQPWMAVPAGRYAAGLRQHVKNWEPDGMIDVLIIGAFVEARSCERFAALAPFVDEQLASFYRYLLKSESRHFADYLSLASLLDPSRDLTGRIAEFREIEADLISRPDPELRFHSGLPVASA